MISCTKDDKNIQPIDYPIDIPFTEYSLAGTSCNWNLIYGEGYDYEKIIIINSKEELNNYVKCIGESSYHEIDFTKFTLLLANGIASSSYEYVGCVSLLIFSDKNYNMEIDLFLTELTSLTPWQVPIIVKKIDEDSVINLIINNLISQK